MDRSALRRHYPSVLTSPRQIVVFLGSKLRSRLLLGWISLSLLSSCQRYWVCDEQDPARSAELPERLSETGLYADLASDTLAAGVFYYRPEFALWSDGAEKRRWVSLPQGSVIDTSDMDNWRFPRGTKLWKEFSVDGQRVETRLLFKAGASDDDWISLSYVWNETQSEALAAPWGVVDARAGHDVPAAGECMACHGGRKGRILGFSAIQLATPADPDTKDGSPSLDLTRLIAEQRLSNPPERLPSVPGNPVERAALGYLHANCSHCHNQDRPPSNGARCFDPHKPYDFTVSADSVDTPQSTATYRTALGSAFKPGDPDGSRAIKLMSGRGMFKQMPPLATEHVDSVGLAQLRSWVQALR